MSVHLPLASATQRRIAYGLLFALLLGVTAVEVAGTGHVGAALAGGLGPDLALVLGAGTGLAKGQIHPRAVPVYNAVHRFWLPVALVVAATAGLLGLGWLIGGLGWCAHVAMDRMAGYGLRTREGFQRAA
jgi:uncharacterized protein DUF4260